MTRGCQQRFARSGLLVAGLLVAGGCWHGQIAKDDRLMRPPEPPIWSGPPSQGVEAPPPRIAVTRDLFTSVQPGPLVILVRRNPPRQTFIPNRSLVRIDVPAGHLTGPAAANVLAHAVTDMPAAGGPSLRDTIRKLGGELRARVGMERASFIATVPAKEWSDALRAMVDRLKRPSLTRAQLVRLKQEVTEQELVARELSPLLSLVGHLLRNSVADPNLTFNNIEDCALAQMALMYTKHYQPMLIGLWVPGDQDPVKLKNTALRVLSDWQASDSKAEPTPPAPSMPEGIHWAPGPGPSRVALVLPVTAKPELMMLQEVLSLGGVGGRLGRQLHKSLGYEPVFRAREVGSLRERFLVLETAVPPEQVLPIWRALSEARVSLIHVQPRGTELKVARDRVRLRLLTRQAEPDEWFDAAALRVLDRRSGGPAQDLAVLHRLVAKDVAEALPAFAKLTPAMVVLGGTPPEGTRIPITRANNILAKTRVQATQRSAAEREVAARKHLDRAVRAIGGAARLRLVTGFSSKARRRMKDGMEMTEETWFRMPARMRRIVRVLNTRIETVVSGDSGSEHAGQDTVRLTAGQAMNAWLEPARHPLTLLAEYTRGQTRYQLVSVRSIAGREMALLERLAANQLRLRLVIDVGSGLPRIVESWEHRTGRGLLEVRESYDDYRTVDGLRIPHRCQTVINDAAPVETIWEAFAPKAPEDKDLKPGGAGDTGR